MQKHDGGDEACSTRAYVSDPVIARTRASYCACALAAPAQVPDKWMSTVVSPLCALCITNGAHYRHFIDSVPWHTNSGFPYSPRRAVTWKLTEGRASVYVLTTTQHTSATSSWQSKPCSDNLLQPTGVVLYRNPNSRTKPHYSPSFLNLLPTPFYTRYQSSHPTIIFELLTTHLFVSELYWYIMLLVVSSVNSTLRRSLSMRTSWNDVESTLTSPCKGHSCFSSFHGLPLLLWQLVHNNRTLITPRISISLF